MRADHFVFHISLFLTSLNRRTAAIMEKRISNDKDYKASIDLMNAFIQRLRTERCTDDAVVYIGAGQN
jgi:hypothetical protein